jgi:hypothetical protein
MDIDGPRALATRSCRHSGCGRSARAGAPQLRGDISSFRRRGASSRYREPAQLDDRPRVPTILHRSRRVRPALCVWSSLDPVVCLERCNHGYRLDLDCLALTRCWRCPPRRLLATSGDFDRCRLRVLKRRARQSKEHQTIADQIGRKSLANRAEECAPALDHREQKPLAFRGQ